MKISLMQYVLCTAALCCSLFYGADGVYLTLKRYGTRIAPNSVIEINRVGREYSSFSSYYYGRYTNEGPLVCHSEDPTCCRAEDNPIEYEETGDWFYPNGDVVGSSSSYSSFFVTRNRQTLALERSSSYPTGVYCCDIDSMNSTENITMEEPMLMNYTNSSSAICVGLYSSYQLRRCRDLYLSGGSVTYDSPYIPGRIAHFTCFPGYNLVGPSTRECMEYGWSRYTPSCQYDCGPPPPISNGKVITPHGTTTGRQAIYSCNEGYVLLGRNVKYCDRYGSRGWSPYYCSDCRYDPLCVDTRLIQLKFSPSQYCLSWDRSQSSTIMNSLSEVVVNAINEYRMKGYKDITAVTTQNLRNSFVSCRSSQNETTFRTTLLGSANTSAEVYANLLQAWVNENPSIQLQWYVVDIDNSCPVSISSRYEAECGDTVNPAVTQCINHCKRWGSRFSDRG